MTMSKSMAIVGIWLGIGLSSFGAGEAVMLVAIFGLIATAFMVQA
jgi:hypothetical protein